jgi:hypothetical protein
MRFERNLAQQMTTTRLATVSSVTVEQLKAIFTQARKSICSRELRSYGLLSSE